MESKNKVFVAVLPERGSRLVLKYYQGEYIAVRGDATASMFETREDALRALKQVAHDSVIFQSPHKIYIFDNPDGACPTQVTACGLPKGHRALSPEEIANERKFAAVPRTVDFKAQEEERAAATLPEMEQSLIAEFTERCKMGFKEYGPVFLGKRNWGKELKEEALDGLFYALMASKTMGKYGDLIKALEEASDDDLSMDACSPDPLKQAAYLVKKYASELGASEKHVAFLKTELERRRHEYDSLNDELKALHSINVKVVQERNRAAANEVTLLKALEDEREAKRVAEASSQKTMSELVWQRDEARKQRDTAEAQAEDLSERIVPALNRELGELRKAVAHEFTRAEALNVELAAAILRCASMEAAAARWKEDADMYFKEAQHLRANQGQAPLTGRPR